MTNNNQGTAVEWQFEQLFNSFEKFNNGEYTFDEYLSSNLRIREQAKEMEKQQIIEAHTNGYVIGGGNGYLHEPEQYYNKTTEGVSNEP